MAHNVLKVEIQFDEDDNVDTHIGYVQADMLKEWAAGKVSLVIYETEGLQATGATVLGTHFGPRSYTTVLEQCYEHNATYG